MHSICHFGDLIEENIEGSFSNCSDDITSFVSTHVQAHSQVIKAGAQDCVARAKMNAGHQEEAAGVLPVPGYMDYLVQQGTTPAERFWSMPTLCTNNPRSAALVPLLKQVS